MYLKISNFDDISKNSCTLLIEYEYAFKKRSFFWVHLIEPKDI